jgi:hypothetical protein
VYVYEPDVYPSVACSLYVQVKEVFGEHSGCITPLTLIKDPVGTVSWVLDEALVEDGTLKICTGCGNPLDHSQHQVVDIPHTQLLEILSDSGHSPVMTSFV